MIQINTERDLERLCELYVTLKLTLVGFRTAAKQKNFTQPNFTLTAFILWCTQQQDYEEIMTVWEASDYHKNFRPKMRILNLHNGRYDLANFAMSSYDILQGEFNQS